MEPGARRRAREAAGRGRIPLIKYRIRNHTIVRTVRWRGYPKQRLALSCAAKELFYGGAAGGGKTDFLIADFLAGAAKYGKHWHGIIIRQTTNQFAQIYQRCDALFPVGTKFRKSYKGCTNVYVMPNGATLQIAYLKYDKDVQNYQGNEYTWIGFDEMGNYATDYAWVFMMSRNRSSHGVPCYMRGTGNPGGPGQGWIRQRFMFDGNVKRDPYRMYLKHVTLPDGSETDITQCFIPSFLSDNPSLNSDPSYAATLSGLPRYLRNAMLLGLWEDYTGNVFEVFSEAKHVIKPILLDSREWFKFCALDWGWGKPYSLGWWAVNGNGRMIKYREMYGCSPDEYNVGVRKGSDVLAKEAWDISLAEGVHDIVVDPKCYSTDDDHETVAANFSKVGWDVVPANNDRKNGLVHFNQMLANETVDESGESVPMLTIYACCEAFIRTVPRLTPAINDPEDVNTELEDHAYDESRYASMSDFALNPQRYIARQNANRIHAAVEDWNPLA